ncbi:MAG: penicillin-binding protein 2 [Nitrospinae bacterium]|nr:penicillin-binding protein 2 [Nitrospinota bacterium]
MRSGNGGSAGGVKRDWYKARVYLVSAVILVWFAVLSGRLAQLMLFSDERVDEYSENLHFGHMRVHLPRGVIYDRNFNEMAVSIDMNSIYMNPRLMENPAKAIKTLADMLEPEDATARDALHKKMLSDLRKRSRRSFIWVRRKVEPELAEKVRKADLPGVGFVKESKRFYPKRDIAAKIIGFCGMDNQGLYGIEYAYNNVMRPLNSQFVVLKDALGRPVSMPEAMELADKAAPLDMVLTIDERVQYITEKALEKQVLKSGAKGGVAIVMDPATGEILAMAEQPRYNPNNFARYSAENMKPKAVAESVEPGSTFKLFVVASAMDERLVTPDDVIDCELGSYSLGGRQFKEAHKNRYGNLTVSEIIAKSSNIGAIKIGEMLGPQRLMRHLKDFGFGAKTEIDLPGEAPGLLRPVSQWSATSLPSISFGQETSVTPIQLITGVAVFANGGYLVRPHFLRAKMREGEVDSVTAREVVGRPITAATAMLMREMMKGVVTGGTGENAAIPGYTVAGKTGTAQKIDPVTRAYSTDKYLASFVGFFPVEAPRLVILVMVDEPKGVEWGGAVAAPVFSEIGARAARALRIPSTDSEIYEINWRKLSGKDRVAGAGNGGRAIESQPGLDS